MLLNILEDGTMEGLYSDDLDYEEFGEATVERASNVEPVDGGWGVHIIETGEDYGPFKKRKEALKFEVELLEGRMIETPGRVKELLS